MALVEDLGVGPVRDVGLLESAAARPRTSLWGGDAYPTLGSKAAALLDSLVNNHALVDGNKRLGWLATVVFLDLNGWWELRTTMHTTSSSLWRVVGLIWMRLLRRFGRGALIPNHVSSARKPAEFRFIV